ncbi:MAG: hypothetical protein ACJ8FY_08455 [Gemmataceae bacterium]
MMQMHELKTRCPRCQTLIRLKTKSDEKAFPCPKCKAPVKVSINGAAAPERTAPPVAIRASVPRALPPPAPAQSQEALVLPLPREQPVVLEPVLVRLPNTGLQSRRIGFRTHYLRGVVSRVSRSADISGDHHGFSTSQILTCEIDRHAISLCMPKMPNIHEGDEVAVAGKVKQGTLEGAAYRNLSNGSSGRWDYGIMNIFWLVIGGLVCLAFAGLILPGLLAPFIFFLAVRSFFGALYIRRAYRAVMRDWAW